MGGAGTETEIKLQLDDESAWQRLCQALGPPASEVVQRNHFFDTPDGELARLKLALRVRDEGDRAWVTVKGPKQRCGDAVRRFEDEAAVEVEAWRAIARGERGLDRLAAAPLAALVGRVALERLVEVVRFENLRRSYPLAVAGRDLVLEIDRTVFADGAVDCEIEVEIDDAGDAELVTAVTTAVRDLLERVGLRYRIQPRGKLTRALQRRNSRP
ncbi:MAG: CYTH domain-containing protein [Deltaproteobacteria bacterium]|nr:CYTH domain-containing protein [Deltaproteobacteria bacterium]